MYVNVANSIYELSLRAAFVSVCNILCSGGIAVFIFLKYKYDVIFE